MILTHLLLISNCDVWSQTGECDKNPEYMWLNCEYSCQSMGYIQKSYDDRCPRKKENPVLKKGDLDKVLNHALTFSELQPELVSKNPSIIVFDKFLSENEADHLIKLGSNKYKRSSGLDLQKDGTYKSVETNSRTSLNTWCDTEDCLNDAIVRKITERVENVSGAPHTNFEYAQLLYYYSCKEENQSNCSFYKRHHDYIPSDKMKNQGVRILTCFIYLNDVKKGGHTVFDHISVTPKKGRAILWPNVLSTNPDDIDETTHHEAKPVLIGEKFAANFWVHQYDFREAHIQGCTY